MRMGLALVVAYVVAGWLGLLLAAPPGYASAVFPAAGVAAAAAFMAGAAALPWVFAGSLLLNLGIGTTLIGASPTTAAVDALVIAFGSTAQAAVAGTVLRRLVGYPSALDTGREVACFLVATPLFCLTSATLSLAGLAALGAVPPHQFWVSWASWWVGDSLGVLVVFPLMMVAVAQPRPLWRKRLRSVALPVAAVFASFVLIFVQISAWERGIVAEGGVGWASLAAGRGWASLAAIFGGGLGTALLGALLLIAAGERSRNEKLLEDRTRERDRIWQVSEELLGVGTFEGHFVSFNPAWSRMLGWSEDEIRRMHVNELRHPDDLEIGLESRRRLAEGVPTVHIENRFRCKDGSYRWIAWTMTADEGRIYVIGRDVTQDREAAKSLARAEEEVRQAQLRLHTVLEQLPVGVFVAEAPSARIIYANREVARLLGRAPAIESAAGYAGRGLIDDAGVPLPASEYPMVRAVVHEEIIERRRLRYLRQDGRMIHIEVSAAPIRGADGRVILGVVSLQDISQELASEERLLRAQRMEAIGQLTGGIAHDFNNLLTAILGNLELLGQRPGIESGRGMLENAMRAATRGAQLTNQLLAFSRRQRLETKPLDLNGLVRGMVGMLQSTLGGVVRIDSSLRPGVWPALADPTQIEMVILNLVLNARDAMPLGGSIVVETGNAEVATAEAPEAPPPGAYATVTVSDSGAGMSPEVLARVFEPFFTTKEPGQGSGLGLPQALGVLKQLGGGIALKSRPGDGTSVTIYLPRASEEPEFQRSAQPAAPAAVGGCRVLVIDDDRDVREVVLAMLERLGCPTHEFPSAATALDWLSGGGEADVVLLDFAMPGMNGAEASARIHELQADLPIVIVTGYADLERIPPIESLAGVLKKPFRVDDLAAVLARAIGPRGEVVRLRPRG